MNLLYTRALALIFLVSLVSAVFSQTPEGRLPVKIIESRTRMAQTSAEVCIEELEQCLKTDSTGGVYFENLNSGLYSLIAWAEGYDTTIIPNIQVVSGLNKKVLIELTKKSNMKQLDKMVVVGRKLDQKKPEQISSVSRLDSYELSNTAGTGNDINRVLAVQPSVISGAGEGFDNNLYVRGGHSRENVYLIDGIPFENASHFSSVDKSGGAVGFINSTLVQNLDFYAGGFPARMPSRLSSVIDVNLRTGSFTERKQQFDLNMSGIGLTTEGPMFGSRGSYLASVRLVDLRFLKPLFPMEGLPKYGDLQLKTVFSPTENQTIKLVGIGAFDRYDEDPEMWPYKNGYAEVKYDEYLKQGGGGIFWDIGNDKMRNTMGFTGTARYENQYDDFAKFSQPVEVDTFKFNITQYRTYNKEIDSIVDPGDTMYVQTGRYNSKRIWGSADQRWRLGMNDDFSLYIGNEDQLNAGLFSDYEHFYLQNTNGFEVVGFNVHQPDGITPTIIPDSYYRSEAFSVDSSLVVKHGGAYLEYVFQRGMLKVVTGVRGDYFTVFSDYGISPRIGMSLQKPGIGTFSLSGGLYYQFPSDFSGLLKEIIARNPNWSSTDAPLHDARLQRNWQTVLGYERQIGLSNLLTMETYLKYYDREYPFIRPGYRYYGDVVENKWVWNLDKPDGKKRAYGYEMTFQKKKYDVFYYSLNYSLFRVENKYTDNKWYTDEYSLRNAAGISVGSNFMKHHGISVRLQVSEGKPYTPAVYNIPDNTWMIDSTQEYYGSRLDPLVSLNLRYTFKVFRKWGNIIGYLEVWNVLNYMPVVERYLDSRTGYRDYKVNGILPVAGVTVDF